MDRVVREINVHKGPVAVADIHWDQEGSQAEKVLVEGILVIAGDLGIVVLSSEFGVAMINL